MTPFRALLGLALSLPFAVPAQTVACRPTVVGRLETIPLTSATLHNTRKLRVWLPPGYNPARKYPVLYILDGASAFDACTAYRHEEMSADETLTELISSGAIPPLIAVGVDNGANASGNTADSGARAREFLAWEDPTDPITKNPKGALFPRFIEADVMQAVKARYPILTGPENTALWGASYGGVAALTILVRQPMLFGRMIIESPALQVGNGQLLRDTVSLTLAPARIAVGVGTAELDPTEPNAAAMNPEIVRMNRQLVQNLKSAGTAPQVQLTLTEGGRHDTPTFGQRFAKALLFLYGR